MIAELKIADQRAVGRAAGHAEFILVHLDKKLALIESGPFGGFLEVPEKLVLGTIENLDFSAFAGISQIDDVAQSAPGGFKLPKAFLVHDLIDQAIDQTVDGRDVAREALDQLRFAARERAGGAPQ